MGELSEEKSLQRFQEFLTYPDSTAIENFTVLPKVARLVINKAVNLNGGYHRVERKLKTKKSKLSTTNSRQFNAVYGRTNLKFFQDLIDVLLPYAERLSNPFHKTPSMIDLGSGIGTLVFYFSLTTGFNATGIEFNPLTFQFSCRLKKYIDIFTENKRINNACGKMQLIQGDLFDSKYEALIMNHSIWFMNNAKETFSARSVEIGEETLDNRLVSIFLQMRKGSQLVAFERLPLLDYYSKEINCQEFLSRKRATSWTESSGARVVVFIYRICKCYWRCPECFKRNSLAHHECIMSSCSGRIVRTKGYVLRKKSSKRQKTQFSRAKNINKDILLKM